MRYSLLCMFIITAAALNAQVAFKQGYGTTYNDIPCSISQTPANGYAMMGFTSATDPYMNNYLIVTDEFGDTIWSRNFYNPESERPVDMALTSDGGYIITGWIYAQSWGGNDIEVMKIDSTGNCEWAYRYGETGQYESGLRVIETSDGSYLVSGRCDTAFDGAEYGFLLKLHSNGTVNWFKRYRNPNSNLYIELYGVIEAMNGDYIACGYYMQDSAYSGVIMRTDTSGAILWEKEYSDGIQISGRDIAECPNGDLIFPGLYYNSASGFSEPMLLRTTGNGTVLWAMDYTGLPNNVDAYNFAVNSSGAVCIAASVYIGGNGWQGVALFTDSAGTGVGAFRYETGFTIYYEDVTATDDGGWAILAHQDSMHSVSDISSFRLIKTDANGVTLCGIYGYGIATVPMNITTSSNGIAVQSMPITTNYVSTVRNSGTAVVPICPVEIGELKPAVEISIYPNPASDVLYVQGPQLPGSRMEMYDVTGRVVLSEILTEKENRLAVDGIASGVYFYRITQQGELLSTGKLTRN